jgi:biotin carboxyl carrier protein
LCPKPLKMSLTKIITIVLFVISVALAYYLFSNINETIKFRESITTTEKQIIDKLAVIREAEKVFLEQHGYYTSNWDSLINFIENGKVPVTVRTETITSLSYGEEKVEVKIDTIGVIPAKEKIFKKSFNISAAESGTFMGFMVKEGDYVVKGKKSYKLKRATGEKVDELSFLEQGTVEKLANIKVGDPVKKGQNLINFWSYQLNPDVDIKTLNLVPGSNKVFEIYTAKIDRSGVKVSVIEVKDPAPINPERKESNEAKNRKPLGFGSRTDVSTSGNWE